MIAVISVTLQGVSPTRADDTDKPQLLARIEAGTAVHKVVFSPDGKQIAALDAARHLVICDPKNRKVQAVFSNVARSSGGMCFTPDSKSMIVTDASQIRQVDLKDGKSRELYKHRKEANAPTFSRDGSLLASGDLDGQVIVWDFRAGKEFARLQCKGPILDIVFLKDGNALAIGEEYGVQKGDVTDLRHAVRVWDLKKKEARATLEGVGNAQLGMALSPDGKSLATLGKKVDEVSLWDTTTNKRRDGYRVESGGIMGMAYSADGRLLFAVGGIYQDFSKVKTPGQVTVWDTFSGRRIASFQALNDVIESFALSPDGKIMAVSHARYGSFELWDISSLSKLIDKK